MTDAELIQVAIRHFEKCGTNKRMLDSPYVRETAIVYFKNKPRGNCMVTIDTKTGEIVGAMWTMSEALHPEYEPHIRLYNTACSIAKQSREGAYERFPEGGTEPMVFHSGLFEELARLCPGWTHADYDSALAIGFRDLDLVQQPRSSEPGDDASVGNPGSVAPGH